MTCDATEGTKRNRQLISLRPFALRVFAHFRFVKIRVNSCRFVFRIQRAGDARPDDARRPDGGTLSAWRRGPAGSPAGSEAGATARRVTPGSSRSAAAAPSPPPRMITSGPSTAAASDAISPSTRDMFVDGPHRHRVARAGGDDDAVARQLAGVAQR